ncbi:integumentary mucin A.1-like [Branchiostoma lanceolatum]|uniref:integumentary mucin A.1-like n=1 Tax=Branchiostoma lanceolatum TaxID=7740 RepID=UPI003452E677
MLIVYLVIGAFTESSVALTCYSCQGLRGNSGFDDCSRGLTTTETCAGDQDTCQYLFLSNAFITLVKRACITAADCASSAALTAQRSTPSGTTKDTLLTSDKASDSTMMTLTTDLEASVPETVNSTPGFATTGLGSTQTVTTATSELGTDTPAVVESFTTNPPQETQTDEDTTFFTSIESTARPTTIDTEAVTTAVQTTTQPATPSSSMDVTSQSTSNPTTHFSTLASTSETGTTSHLTAKSTGQSTTRTVILSSKAETTPAATTQPTTLLITAYDSYYCRKCNCENNTLRYRHSPAHNYQ